MVLFIHLKDMIGPQNLKEIISVVTVAGICNSVGGSVFLACHRAADASGEYMSASRLGLLIGNRWMLWLRDGIVPFRLSFLGMR